MKKFLVVWNKTIVSQHDTLESAKQAGEAFSATLQKKDGVVSVLGADIDEKGRFLNSKRIIYEVFM